MEIANQNSLRATIERLNGEANKLEALARKHVLQEGHDELEISLYEASGEIRQNVRCIVRVLKNEKT